MKRIDLRVVKSSQLPGELSLRIRGQEKVSAYAIYKALTRTFREGDEVSIVLTEVVEEIDTRGEA